MSRSLVTERLLAGSSARLTKIHQSQVHRDGWPDFAAFRVEDHPVERRRRSARQWMRRAREEHGSVYEFTTLGRALADARMELELLGAVSRLITDEVRHTELCARMAVACWPEGVASADDDFAWPEPRLPWPEPPARKDRAALIRWVAEAILSSCCLGETLSRPLFDAVATVTTDPVCEAVLRQILRDEHLHATFGWEALADLLDEVDDEGRAWLEEQLAIRFARFERGGSAGISLDELAHTEVVIEQGDPREPNLAHLTPRQYATIFYATIESEVIPRFEALGLDAARAWARRPR